MCSYYDILVSFLITFLTFYTKSFFLLENDEYKILISAVYSNRQDELKTSSSMFSFFIVTPSIYNV
jgi:hypothetical protein